MSFDITTIKNNAKASYKANTWTNVLVPIIASAVVSVLAAIPVVGWAAEFVAVPLMLIGMAGWYTKSLYSPKPSAGEIFAPASKNFGSCFVAGFLKTLFISLWSCLFVIPGIIKTYEYFAVDYIMAENPDTPYQEAFRMSKEMTNGHKMDIFLLQLSFIGWFILSGFTFGILALVYVVPYFNAAMALTYEQLKNGGNTGNQNFSSSNLGGMGF